MGTKGPLRKRCPMGISSNSLANPGRVTGRANYDDCGQKVTLQRRSNYRLPPVEQYRSEMPKMKITQGTGKVVALMALPCGFEKGCSY